MADIEIDRDACDCDGEALVTSEVADWKMGNPTGGIMTGAGTSTAIPADTNRKTSVIS